MLWWTILFFIITLLREAVGFTEWSPLAAPLAAASFAMAQLALLVNPS